MILVKCQNDLVVHHILEQSARVWKRAVVVLVMDADFLFM